MRGNVHGAVLAFAFLLLAFLFSCLHDDGRRCASWYHPRGWVSSRVGSHKESVCEAWK
jgi:hypothetical protein